MESVVPATGLLLLGSWRGRKEGAEKMRSSAQPLENDSWQLLFTSYQFILERLVVLYAIPHPSLSDQVIREHRLCTAINIFYSCMSTMKMEIDNQRK